MLFRAEKGLFWALIAAAAVLAAAPAGFAGRTFDVVALAPSSGGYTFHGAVIQYSEIKISLQGKPRPLPLLALYGRGPYASAQARAEDVARKLEHALDLIEQGGWLTLRNDDLGNPGVWVASLSDNYSKGMEVFTAYEDDARLTPRVNGDRHALAAYVKNLLSAHHLLFFKRSVTPEEYEQVIKSEGGTACAVFRDLNAEFMKVLDREGLKFEKGAKVSVEDRKKLQPALEQTLKVVSDEKRQDLYLLAFLPPLDWAFKTGGGEAKGGAE